MRYFEREQPHIGCKKGDVAEVALLPGAPERADKMAQKLGSYEKVSKRREFRIYNGEVHGRRVTVASTGIGCPSAALAVEELANCGAKVFIRVGTTGAIQEDIELGDVIIVEAAVRDDGTTREYINVEYPAVASFDVVEALRRSAREHGVRHHVGIVRTDDAFYGDPHFESTVKKYKEAGVLSFDMECAAVLTVARLRRLRAGAVLGVVGNIVRGEHGYEDPQKCRSIIEEAEENTIKVAIGAVKYMQE